MGLELLAMGAIVDPFPRCRDPLSGGMCPHDQDETPGVKATIE